MTPKISSEINQDRNQTTTTMRDTGVQGRPTFMHAKSRRLSLRSPRTRNPDRSHPPRSSRRHPSPLARSPRPRIHAWRRSSSPPPCRPRVLGLPSEGLDQALLMALVARVVKLSSGFKVGANWTSQQAREAILGLLRSFGCPLWWIVNALDQAERRPGAKVGNKPVESWGFIRQTVSNWSRGDGTPGSPPGTKSGAPPGPPCPAAVLSGEGNPSRSPPRPGAGVLEAELCELSSAELRDRIAELEAILSNLSSSPRREAGRVSCGSELSAGAEPAGGPGGRVMNGKGGEFGR